MIPRQRVRKDPGCNERWEILERLEGWLETPMIILGFAWLVLLVLDLTGGLPAPLETAGIAIWILFILDFVVKIALAPDKLSYIRENWLSIVALAVPALRVFKVFSAIRALKVARAARGLRFLRLLTSLNRGMGALSISMGRRGVPFVAALTAIVVFAGAAGMLAFERESAGGLADYGTALWWTAMLMTTMGSEFWPKTPEGRLLCFLLALYSFTVFGYLTATLASFFVDQDKTRPPAEVEAQGESSPDLLAEMAALNEQLRRVLDRLESSGDR